MSQAKFKKGTEARLAHYTRDKLGQVEQPTTTGLPGAESDFGYDANNRLTKAGTASYEYDAANNLTKAPGTANAYDNAAELEKGTAVSYTYDKEGERTNAAPAEAPPYNLGLGGKVSGPGNLSAPDRHRHRRRRQRLGRRHRPQPRPGVQLQRRIRPASSAPPAPATASSPRCTASRSTPKATSGSPPAAASRSSTPKANSSASSAPPATATASSRPSPASRSTPKATSGPSRRARKASTYPAAGVQLRRRLPRQVRIADGSEAGQLKEPQALAIDASGNFWVADTGNHRVAEFNAKGEFQRASGSEGTDNGQFKARAISPPTPPATSGSPTSATPASSSSLRRHSTSPSSANPGRQHGQFSEPQGPHRRRQRQHLGG